MDFAYSSIVCSWFITEGVEIVEINEDISSRHKRASDPSEACERREIKVDAEAVDILIEGC